MDLDRFNKAVCASCINDSELAKRIGKSRQTISMYRSNNATPPFEVVISIAEVLEVSALWLMGYDELDKELNEYYKSLDDKGRKKVLEYARDMAKIYGK